MFRLSPTVYRGAINKIRAPTARFVGSQSWAYDRLEELGKVPPVHFSERPPVIITEETLSNLSPKVQGLIDELLKLNVVEMHGFCKAMEEVLQYDESMFFGMAAAVAAPSGGAEAAAPAEKVEEKTSFDIKLGAVDAKAKIKIIKEVRTITGLGLKEAKELVEKAPVTIKEGLKKEEAEQLLKLLTDAGAEASLV